MGIRALLRGSSSGAWLAGALAPLLAAALGGCTVSSPPADETSTVYSSSMPFLRVDAPDPNCLETAGTVRIIGLASDSVGVKRLMYDVTGSPQRTVPITPGREVPFDFAVELPPGEVSIHLSVENVDRNRVDWSTTVMLDSVAGGEPRPVGDCPRRRGQSR